MKQVQGDRPFEVVAIVLLPDHLHCVWELPRGDHDYSTRWRRIKSLFTKGWLDNCGDEGDEERRLLRKASEPSGNEDSTNTWFVTNKTSIDASITSIGIR